MADKVPTTFEMDGLFTQEDIDNRFYVMRNCLNCKTWYQADSRVKERSECPNCGNGSYDMKSQCSLRTFNPKAKKIKKWDEKRAGQ